MVYERILISRQTIDDIVRRLAKDISDAYSGRHITVLVLLEGAKYFAADLLAEVQVPYDVEFTRVSSYLGTLSSGTVTLNVDAELKARLRDRDILVIDDIYDTGRTLRHFLSWIEGCGPKSVKTCVFLEKEIVHEADIAIDFLGRTVPDVYVIGYGMDYDQQYRDLPFIAELASEHLRK
jgi:hypoxanthine phosphoribosyltransferase